MPLLDEFSSLVATLYEAAAEAQHWDRFVAQFYRSMESSRGALTAIAPQPELQQIVLQGYTGSEIRAYAEYYSKRDLVVAAGLQTLRQQSQWIGPLEEILSYPELEASEIYNDHYRSMDMYYASCLMVGATGPYSALGLAAWRPRSSGPFSPEQLHLVDLLAPHLKQAFRLHANLATLRAEREALHSALDTATVAVLTLRADGYILAASGAAETLLSRKEVLVRRSGKLSAVNAARDHTLQLLINSAVRVSGIDLVGIGGSSVPPGGAMLLQQAGSPLAWQVQILPVRASANKWGSNPAALVFISDPGAVPPSRARVLRDLYQLTPLEGRLADLFLQGVDLKQAAEELKLTYENTRFHLKQIFRKTNTSRQTELLRLLLAIPA